MPTFSTTRRVPFTSRQMFDLVADVEQYPKFLPLCEALVVRKRERAGEVETLVVDASSLQVHAASAPEYPSGPFRQVENRWSFAPAEGGCDVQFHIAYEFKSHALQMLVGSIFDRVFRRYTQPFEDRARAVYGAQEAGNPYRSYFGLIVHD